MHGAFRRFRDLVAAQLLQSLPYRVRVVVRWVDLVDALETGECFLVPVHLSLNDAQIEPAVPVEGMDLGGERTGLEGVRHSLSRYERLRDSPELDLRGGQPPFVARESSLSLQPRTLRSRPTFRKGNRSEAAHLLPPQDGVHCRISTGRVVLERKDRRNVDGDKLSDVI